MHPNTEVRGSVLLEGHCKSRESRSVFLGDSNFEFQRHPNNWSVDHTTRHFGGLN
jgi:hypothetical protein